MIYPGSDGEGLPLQLDDPRQATLAAGASIMTISLVVSAVGGGLSTLVVARALGPSGAGAYGVVLATLTALIVLADLGLDTSALYGVGGGRWQAGNAVRQLQLAALVLGGSGAGLGLLVGSVLRHSAFHRVSLGTLALAVIAVPFALSWTYSSSVALARSEYRRAAFPVILQGIAGLALAAVLAPRFGLRGAVSALALSHVVTTIVALPHALRATREASDGWRSRSRSELSFALRFGSKANLTRLMELVNQRADVLILNAYASQAVVGRYSVALSLTSMQVLLPLSLSRAVVPRVSSLQGKGTSDEGPALAAKSVKHGVLLSVVGAACFAVIALAIPAAFGHRFAPAVKLAWILVPGTAAYGIAVVLSAIVVGRGHPRYILQASAIVTPLTLILYAILIPRFSATGAAVASTLSYSATLVVYWFFFRRVSGIRGIGPLLPGRAELEDYRVLLVRARVALPSYRAARRL